MDAFPYSMQDTEAMTCAETALLNLMDYYGTHFPEYRTAVPSEIAELVHNNRHDRSLPSAGLSKEIISMIFLHTGFSPKIYDSGAYKDQDDRKRMTALRHIMHYHIESGIPVAVTLREDGGDLGHVLICIGHSTGELFDAETIPMKMMGAHTDETKRQSSECIRRHSFTSLCLGL